MTDIDDDVTDDFDDLDDDDFAVDLSGGLPDEGEHQITIKSARWNPKNPEKNGSRGVTFELELDPDKPNEYVYVWLGNDDGAHRFGNQMLGSIIEMATGDKPPRNINMKDYGPYKDDKGRTCFAQFEGVMGRAIIRHIKNKDGMLQPQYTFKKFADD